jgi:hypothetical protein
MTTFSDYSEYRALVKPKDASNPGGFLGDPMRTLFTLPFLGLTLAFSGAQPSFAMPLFTTVCESPHSELRFRSTGELTGAFQILASAEGKACVVSEGEFSKSVNGARLDLRACGVHFHIRNFDSEHQTYYFLPNGHHFPEMGSCRTQLGRIGR